MTLRNTSQEVALEAQVRRGQTCSLCNTPVGLTKIRVLAREPIDDANTYMLLAECAGCGGHWPVPLNFRPIEPEPE